MNKNKKCLIKLTLQPCTLCPEFRGASNCVGIIDLFKEKMKRRSVMEQSRNKSFRHSSGRRGSKNP